jgi:hypothetical protein
VGLLVDSQIDPFGQIHLDLMGIPEGKGGDPAFDVGAITDSDDIQFADKAVDTPVMAFDARARVNPCAAAYESPSRRSSRLPSF